MLHIVLLGDGFQAFLCLNLDNHKVESKPEKGGTKQLVARAASD
jgi:hypothetical protein